MAGSATNGRPNSWSPSLAPRDGVLAAGDLGKKPSRTTAWTSSRVSSDWMLPPMIREPRPAIVTGQRSSGLLSPSSFSLAVRQAIPQGAPLLGVEPGAAELLLDAVGQGQVDVVAAEHQVVADGHPAEPGPGRASRPR